ncbi:MAG: glycosyltransferase family 39 protein [Verrucomicrobiota bacterium]|nr:glycosyltransferase family 39 protein [Verrucomicrobiota bacterium]
MTTRNESILWLVLVVFAAVLRFAPIGSHLPYIDYVDEGHVLHPVIGILQAKRFDSGVYTYPPLTSYLTIAAIKAYSPIYRLIHHHKISEDFPADRDFHTPLGDNYDLITPPEIIWLGRLVVACLSVGTVVLSGAIARRLGGVRAGLFAMLFTALCPALVSRGAIVSLDTTGTFFVAAALYFCQRMRTSGAWSESSTWRWVAAAGIASGFAFGGKFTAGAVFVTVLVTIACLPLPRKSQALLALIAGAGLFAGIFCSVPGAVLHPSGIAREIRGISRFYQTIHSEAGYWSTAFSAGEVGYLLMIAGVAGFIWMLWYAPTRGTAFGWIAFGLLLLAAIVSSSFQPFRNVLPLIPLLCIAAALLLDRIRFASAWWVAPLVVMVIALSLGWPSAAYLRARKSHIDARIKAIDWLQQHASKGERVIGIRELAILPAEWKRIAASLTVVSWSEAADLLEREQFDYVVTGEFDLRSAPDPDRLSAYFARWKERTAPFPVQASFGAVATPIVPYFWRTNDERILILQKKAAEL